MKTKEITVLTDKELRDKISEEKLTLTKITLSHGISPMENPMKIRYTRKLVARLKTEDRKRSLSKSAK